MRGEDAFRSCPVFRYLMGLGICLLAVPDPAAGQVGTVLDPPNLLPGEILSQLDIDGDGQPDQAPDSDRDGLPDNWETGGLESLAADGTQPDRFVSYPLPAAIGPGTPPTPIFSRLSVTTQADNWDTDGDGLSDFVEAFGLMFIDDNGDGILDFDFTDVNANGQWDPGEPIDVGSDWMDLNADGLPSIGEWPVPGLFANVDLNGDGSVDTFIYLFDTNGDGNVDTYVYTSGRRVRLPTNGTARVNRSDLAGLVTGDYPPATLDLNGDGTADTIVSARTYDFDGFMFTDPTDDDTDGDGVSDGSDWDPLINPETFGIQTSTGFVRAGASTSDADIDNDGLGNGSDFGNDLTQQVDYPTDVANLIDTFRPDRKETIPESLIEDLVGADWDGNGLWRITDVRDFTRSVTEACLLAIFPDPNDPSRFDVDKYRRYFVVQTPSGARNLFALATSTPACESPSDRSFRTPDGECLETRTSYGARDYGMGVQNALLPAGPSEPFLPDVKIWAILYAWRMPGFDIDGNGYVGSPDECFVLDDRHKFTPRSATAGGLRLDGQVTLPAICGGIFGNVGTVSGLVTFFALAVAVTAVPRLRRRR